MEGGHLDADDAAAADRELVVHFAECQCCGLGASKSGLRIAQGDGARVAWLNQTCLKFLQVSDWCVTDDIVNGQRPLGARVCQDSDGRQS